MKNVSVHETLQAPILSCRLDTTPTAILSTARKLIDASERLHDKIVRTVDQKTATFDNTILPIIHEENRLLRERQLVASLASVSPSEEIRQAA
jgi:metallopeptidase MepB